MKLVVLFIVFGFFSQECLGHECYVCLNQDSNQEKCRETVEPCMDIDQDRCLTEIKWSSTPYWEIGAPMQYYINKSCATEHDCNRAIAAATPFCDHIWWKDWRCAECCRGDRCNYFATLASGIALPSALLTAFAAALLLMLQL